MRQKRTLYVLAGILALEAVAAPLFPGRLPRAARLPVSGIALVAAAGIWLMARQKGSGRQK